MAAPTSFFLDKLSPELRLRVYSHVFGSSRVIKPSASDTALGIRKDPAAHIMYSFAPPAPEIHLDISILLSNKLVFTEALPVLYDQRSIRATTEDLDQLLQSADFMERVRHIEVADCIGCYQNGQFHSVLCRLRILPQIRSLVILSDCLGLVDHQLSGSDEYLTVAKFCEVTQLGEARCVEIGRYQLYGMFGRFEVVNRRLRQMWSDVRNRPQSDDAYQDLVSTLERWSPQSAGYVVNHVRIALALQTSLCCWVNFRDMLISTAMSGELETLRGPQVKSQAKKFLTLRQYSGTTRPHQQFSARHLVDGTADRNDLRRWLLRNVEDRDDQNLLSWATEYLSANIFAYAAPVYGHGGRVWTHRRSSWAMIDGSLSTIEYWHVCFHQTASGLATQIFIPPPRQLGSAIYRETASLYLRCSPIPLEGILTLQSRNFPNLSNIEMKQITHLCIAVDERQTAQLAREREEDLNEYNRWSSHLLRRYITATSPSSQANLHHATVDDLRRVMKRVLSVVASPKEMELCGLTPASNTVRTAPPADFDGDLFQPLAWRYGPLLERAWREYTATADSTSMDLY